MDPWPLGISRPECWSDGILGLEPYLLVFIEMILDISTDWASSGLESVRCFKFGISNFGKGNAQGNGA